MGLHEYEVSPRCGDEVHFGSGGQSQRVSVAYKAEFIYFVPENCCIVCLCSVSLLTRRDTRETTRATIVAHLCQWQIVQLNYASADHSRNEGAI